MLLLALMLVFGWIKGDENIRHDIITHPNWRLLDRGDDCGSVVTNRIIGGKEAELGEFPWLALLGYKEEENTTDFQCGGSVISERYILTAAHCSSQMVGSKLATVRLGEHDLSNETDCNGYYCAEPVQNIEVEEEICHKNYNDDRNENDICLLRLAKPIQFNDFVYVICLPIFEFMDNNHFEGTFTQTVGWGITNLENETLSDVPMVVNLPIVSSHRCAAIYQKYFRIKPQHICAGGEVGRDSCDGDSGGPLMMSSPVNTVPRHFVIGITSKGPIDCGKYNAPAIYTTVSHYMIWILDNIHE